MNRLFFLSISLFILPISLYNMDYGKKPINPDDTNTIILCYGPHKNSITIPYKTLHYTRTLKNVVDDSIKNLCVTSNKKHTINLDTYISTLEEAKNFELFLTHLLAITTYDNYIPEISVNDKNFKQLLYTTEKYECDILKSAYNNILLDHIKNIGYQDFECMIKNHTIPENIRTILDTVPFRSLEPFFKKLPHPYCHNLWKEDHTYTAKEYYITACAHYLESDLPYLISAEISTKNTHSQEVLEARLVKHNIVEKSDTIVYSAKIANPITSLFTTYIEKKPYVCFLVNPNIITLINLEDHSIKKHILANTLSFGKMHSALRTINNETYIGICYDNPHRNTDRHDYLLADLKLPSFTPIHTGYIDFAYDLIKVIAHMTYDTNTHHYLMLGNSFCYAWQPATGIHTGALYIPMHDVPYVTPFTQYKESNQSACLVGFSAINNMFRQLAIDTSLSAIETTALTLQPSPNDIQGYATIAYLNTIIAIFHDNTPAIRFYVLTAKNIYKETQHILLNETTQNALINKEIKKPLCIKGTPLFAHGLCQIQENKSNTWYISAQVALDTIMIIKNDMSHIPNMATLLSLIALQLCKTEKKSLILCKNHQTLIKDTDIITDSSACFCCEYIQKYNSKNAT